MSGKAQERAGAPSERSESGAPARAGAFGLVPSSTSDKDIVIDRLEARYKRLRKNVVTSTRLLRDSLEQDGFRTFMAMLTLTYAPGVKWQPHHISDLHKNIRAWLNRRGHSYAYVWVCELQKRGVPHFHILIWVPYGLRLPKADYQGWWPHGMTNIEKVEKPVGYMIKYLSKVQQGIHWFEKGQRTHGSGGLNATAKRIRRWWMAPSYVRKKWADAALDVRPAPGGGWMAKATGEWMPSPWKIISYGPWGAVIRWIAGPEIGIFATTGEPA